MGLHPRTLFNVTLKKKKKESFFAVSFGGVLEFFLKVEQDPNMCLQNKIILQLLNSSAWLRTEEPGPSADETKNIVWEEASY